MRFALRLAAVASAASALAACATASGPADPVVARPGAPYGLYLAGQAALQGGQTAQAARLFDAASAAAPEDETLRERAFTAALLAGDVPKAARLSPAADGAGSAGGRRLGRLVRAVEALATGRGKVAAAELSGESLGFPHRAAASLLEPWAKAAAGDVAGSVAPSAPGRDRMLAGLDGRTRALLLERARRPGEADAAYLELLSSSPDAQAASLAYGAFLERKGRRAEAAGLYRRALADGDDGALRAASTRVEARRPAPPLPTIQEGAADVLLAPAVALAGERQTELTLTYLRLALRLDPRLDEAWLLLGDQLSAQEDREGARAAYAKVRKDGDAYTTAQARLAFSYEQAGDRVRALQLTEAAAAAAPADRTVQLAHADMLRQAERYADAALVLDRLIAREGEGDWRLLYLRGVSHEQAGNWPAAERDLTAALKLAPEEPDVLNYLGYSWVDRGERVPEAFAMIERAVALRPESGAIVDSLGWGHYRLGRYPEAVTHLEEAVELEPADPTINDHLGDAYWRQNRRVEAQFQWRRVLSLDPDEALKASVESKLATGLGPPATTVAGS